MSSIEDLIPDTWYLISIGDIKQQPARYTANGQKSPRKPYELLRLYIVLEAHAAQNPDILRVLAV